MIQRLAIVFLLCVSASATVRYVAQSAGTFSGGSACNGQTAITVATFNSTTLSAGDISYLCGTITASGGASAFITISQSGSSGNPISLVFDTGAVLTAPYWGVSGPISLSGVSYITIDGGTNGIIQATANGTGLANQVYNSEGITLSSVSNSEVKNLTIQNLYVHLCSLPLSTCTDDAGNTSPSAVYWLGGSGVTVDHNTFHDEFAGFRYVAPGAGTYSNISLHDNVIYNVNWSMNIGLSTSSTNINTMSIYKNTMHDWLNWGTDNNSNHHDGVFIFTVSAGCSITGSGMSGAQVYDNIGYGILEAITGFVFLEDDNCAGQLITGTGVYNNVFYDTYGDIGGDGYIVDWAQDSVIANNTVQSYSTNSSLWGIIVYGQGSTFYNNIVSTAFVNLGYAAGSSLTASDYNDGYDLAYWGDNGGTPQTTLANWQSATSLDAHSINTNPNLNASSSPPYQLTNTSSPAYRTGTNLTSLCSTYAALCTDANGVARPSSGAWDMGAYYLTSSSTVTPAPALGMFAWDWNWQDFVTQQ